MEISRTVASNPEDPEVPLGAAVVLEDVLAHPDSSVGEITARTGFVQSYVSATVARLRSLGALETASDPADGRRTLVRVAARVSQGFVERGARSVDGAVAEALADTDPQAAERTMEMLEELAGLLLSGGGSDEVAGGRW